MKDMLFLLSRTREEKITSFFSYLYDIIINTGLRKRKENPNELPREKFETVIAVIHPNKSSTCLAMFATYSSKKIQSCSSSSILNIFSLSSSMASQNPNLHKAPLYPRVIHNDPDLQSTSSSRPNLYPTIDETDLAENLIPDNYHIIPSAPSAPPESHEETLLVIPGVLVHLIDKDYSVELATGDLSLFRLLQDKNTVAILANVGDDIQWPLTKDLTAVKLDDSHYFFSFQALKEDDSDSSDDEKEKSKKKKKKDKGPMDDSLNYGLTIASKGQEALLKELDDILKSYSTFSVQKVEENAALAMGGTVARELSPDDLKSEKKKEVLEERCAQYWTTLAPNVEEYSGSAAKLVAQGSGQLIKGILWCGDVSAERLMRGNEVLKQRMITGTKAQISPETLKRIQRCNDLLIFDGICLFHLINTMTTLRLLSMLCCYCY